MQLYVLDRAKNTLATTSSFYNDKHHKELTAGASIFEFTIDKSDAAAQYMATGNYLVFKDDRGRAWSFTILSYDETQTTKTVAAEDVSIELLNKAMDVWNTDQAYPFSYYFDLVTKGTPWTLGVNQLTDLSRKLVYTGRDTGLGRLLSILKGFDNAECQFNIKVAQNKPVEFIVDVYKSIGTIQDNIQIVYNNELADIKKTESRAQFVTALAGIGGLVENQATTDPGLEKHIDFADIDYKDDNFVSPKGDKFLRAVTANRTFNPGTTTYIEDFYDYDTQSAQELLNRTLTQLKERSEPQYTYNADVKVIDPTLDIGDTVTIIDHDYNPALYLQARVATLDKSYTDPTQGAITFCNYRVLNSNLSDQLRAMQNIIDQLPTSASIKVINNNIVQMITDNAELKKQVALSFESANGKSRIWFSKSATAQDGDVAFIKNADGATEIWKFVEGAWKLDTGLATFEDVKKAASAAADAGSQATIAGSQASAAGADAKSAGDFAASAASQSTIETAAARSTANSAADAASDAVTAAFGAGTTADQAKSAAASAQSDAADALAEATKSFNDAQNAISNATKAMDAAEQNHTTVTGLVTKVDDIAGTIQTLATTQSVDKLAGTVTTVQNLAQFASDGLKLKADSSTVSDLDGRVTSLSGQLDVQSDLISAKVTASDVTGMLGNYATQSWSQGQISAAKNEISASVETVKNTVDNLQVGGTNLASGTSSDWQKVSVQSGWGTTYLSNQVYEIKDGETYTLQVEARNITSPIVIEPFGYNAAGKWVVNLAPAQVTNKDGKISITFTANLPDGYAYFKPDLAFTSSLTGAGSYEYRRFKLETGTMATDWSPAPEDQATIDWTKAQLDITDKKIAAGITTVTTTLNNNIASATAGMATTTWTNTQINAAKTAINLSVEQSITTTENTLNNNIANATNDMATQTWTKGQLSVTNDNVSASVQKLHDAVTGEISTATTDMATQTWTQGKLDLTASGFKTQISSVKSTIDNLQAGENLFVKSTAVPGYVSGTNIANPVAGNNELVSDFIKIDPTQPYIFQTWVTVPASNILWTSIGFYDASKVPISRPAWDYVTQTTATAVHYVNRLNQAGGTAIPSNAAFIRISYRQYDDGKVSFTQGTVLRDYAPNPADQATLAQFTSIEETLSGVQVTANNAVTQSQYTQLANQFTTTITGVSGAANAYTAASSIFGYTGCKSGEFVTGGALNEHRSDYILIDPTKSYFAEVTATSATSTIGNWVAATFYDKDKKFISRVDATDINGDAVTPMTTRISFNNNNDNTAFKKSTIPVNAKYVIIQSRLFNDGTMRWAESFATSSQFTQLQGDINLRVKTGDLISQINVSSEGILIDGRKVHITGDTTIDTGVIKTAMIADAAITNGKIANAAIDNAKIANAAINSAKIADLAVGSAQIADGAISSAKIGNAAITSAKIADASIIDAKIVSLDGSKIVAHSITADQLDVNAIEVGLNTYGIGWQITPASIKFLPSASSTKASLILTGEGIILGDTTTGEMLGEITGSPYNLKTDTWFNGFNTILKYNGADYWAVLSEESDGTIRPRLMYSRNKLAELGVFQGWTFNDNTHFATIGPMDPDDKAQMKVVRVQIADRWCTGFMNSGSIKSGIVFADNGATYIGRADKWYNLFDIVNKLGLGV